MCNFYINLPHYYSCSFLPSSLRKSFNRHCLILLKFATDKLLTSPFTKQEDMSVLSVQEIASHSRGDGRFLT